MKNRSLWAPNNIHQQLCRWLLLSLDRLQGNELIMTQGLIVNMLGVRREGVTEAAGKLQKMGVIDYERGHITVLDWPTLEEMACECYDVVKKETNRLLPRAESLKKHEYCFLDGLCGSEQTGENVPASMPNIGIHRVGKIPITWID